MSTEAVCKTKLQDKAALIESLEEIYGAGKVKVTDGVKISGYYSSKKIEIEVKINGLYGTAGFFKNKENDYEFVYDSMDRSKLKSIIGDKENNELKQVYTKKKVLKAVGQLRGQITSQEKDKNGKIKLKVRVF